MCFLWLAPAPSASGSVLKPPPAPGRVRAPWAASATRFLGEGDSAVSFHMVTVSDRDSRGLPALGDRGAPGGIRGLCWTQWRDSMASGSFRHLPHGPALSGRETQ